MAVGAGVQDQTLDISLWILAILVTIINTVIVTVVLRNGKLRTLTNGFIVSLAFSDLLTGAVLFPVYILGPEFLIGYTNSIILISGVANVCSLSYDRYMAVFNPFRYRQVVSKAFKPLIVISWVVPTLIGLLPLAWHWADVAIALRLNEAYIMVLVTLVGLPYLFILFAYCRIFVRIRKKSKDHQALRGLAHIQTPVKDSKTQIQESSALEPDVSLRIKQENHRKKDEDSGINREYTRAGEKEITDGNLDLKDQEQNVTPQEQSFSSRAKEHVLKSVKHLSLPRKRNCIAHERNSRAERRVAKTLAAVVLVFFLSWFPVIYISLAYGVFGAGLAPPGVVVFSAFTVAIGSLINPALYAFLKPDLRKEMAKLFCKVKSLRNVQSGKRNGPQNRQCPTIADDQITINITPENVEAKFGHAKKQTTI